MLCAARMVSNVLRVVLIAVTARNELRDRTDADSELSAPTINAPTFSTGKYAVTWFFAGSRTMGRLAQSLTPNGKICCLLIAVLVPNFTAKNRKFNFTRPM